jgi:hypothetical protein
MTVNPKNQSVDWTSAQKQITVFLEEVLFKIEWNYGDCRAPFKYPPTFRITKLNDGSFEYQCTIELDFGDNEKILLKSTNPSELFSQVKSDINKRFSSMISNDIE